MPRAQRLEEGDVAVTIERVQNDIGLAGGDGLDGGLDVRAAEQNVVFADHLTAQRADPILHDGMRGMRKDVVRADEEEAATEMIEGPFDGRNDLLIGRRAGIDDVRRLLQPLVLHR